LYNASEVEGLARRGRPRRAPGAAELVIETELTEITGDHLRYRGLDVIGLAGHRSFEEVASLLWTGSTDEEPPGRWEATEAALAAGRAAQAALPDGTLPLERLQVIVRARGDRPAAAAPGYSRGHRRGPLPDRRHGRLPARRARRAARGHGHDRRTAGATTLPGRPRPRPG
jgi:hypothetical protein